MPKTLLVKNADVLVTMDAARREIRNGGLFVADHSIVAVGPTADLPQTADQVLDLKGHIVIPGLINTHHHMFQTLTRAWPAAQNVELFDWLTALFPVWQRLTPDMIKVSTKTAMAELILSGCTTTMDHLYLYPNGCRLDDEVEAAREIGMRFHASRGAMSVGVSKGGCRQTAWSRTRRRSSRTCCVSSTRITMLAGFRCCASWLRRARRSR